MEPKPIYHTSCTHCGCLSAAFPAGDCPCQCHPTFFNIRGLIVKDPLPTTLPILAFPFQIPGYGMIETLDAWRLFLARYQEQTAAFIRLQKYAEGLEIDNRALTHSYNELIQICDLFQQPNTELPGVQ